MKQIGIHQSVKVPVIFSVGSARPIASMLPHARFDSALCSSQAASTKSSEASSAKSSQAASAKLPGASVGSTTMPLGPPGPLEPKNIESVQPPTKSSSKRKRKVPEILTAPSSPNKLKKASYPRSSYQRWTTTRIYKAKLSYITLARYTHSLTWIA